MILAISLLLFAIDPLLWRAPGVIETIDFTRPAQGAQVPRPPFTFIREELGGTSAKVLIRDAAGTVWQVKGGPEARAEAFATRLVSALGYFAEPTSFLASGSIESIGAPLKRAAGFIQADGSFTWASFEMRDASAKFLGGQSWLWNDNPFTGTPELAGLKILMMLVSNWDNKDARDQRRGSNTGILEMSVAGNLRQVFFVTDWGQSLGGWGRWLGRTNWNCRDFTDQTAYFVNGVRNGRVRFGYGGQHTTDFHKDITVSDVQWLMQYLGRVTDAQIRNGLLASGANPEEENCFASQLRRRIEALRRIAEGPPAIP